jgi:DNA-binding transcriptional LysR family regulator
MRDLDLKTLRLLVAVCDHQNIKAAAAQEHIEPSAISKRIAQLEDMLGAPLLVRGRRGVRPTPAGQALLEHARTMLFTLQRIESDVDAFKGGVRGHVSLVASISAIAASLLDDVAAFMGDPEHRDIKIDIEERVSPELIRIVKDGRASVGICWDNIDFEGLEHRPYRGDQLALAVYEDHPLSRKDSVAYARTLGYEHVGLNASTAVHAMLQRAAARLGKTVNYRVVVSSFDAAFRAVNAKLGIAVVPMQLSQIYASAGHVRMIPLTDPWARRRFAACFREFDTLPPAARRMVEFLTACAASA